MNIARPKIDLIEPVYRIRVPTDEYVSDIVATSNDESYIMWMSFTSANRGEFTKAPMWMQFASHVNISRFVRESIGPDDGYVTFSMWFVTRFPTRSRHMFEWLAEHNANEYVKFATWFALCKYIRCEDHTTMYVVLDHGNYDAYVQTGYAYSEMFYLCKFDRQPEDDKVYKPNVWDLLCFADDGRPVWDKVQLETFTAIYFMYLRVGIRPVHLERVANEMLTKFGKYVPNSFTPAEILLQELLTYVFANNNRQREWLPDGILDYFDMNIPTVLLHVIERSQIHPPTKWINMLLYPEQYPKDDFGKKRTLTLAMSWVLTYDEVPPVKLWHDPNQWGSLNGRSMRLYDLLVDAHIKKIPPSLVPH